MNNIKISGAGPAGLTAAINLTKAGYKVDVFEKHADVGSRFHGDYQGLENWSDKEDAIELFKRMNIDINFDYTPFSKLILSNKDKMWSFNCNRNAFYLVKRGSKEETLDEALKDQAIDIGVNIHFKEVIPENEADIVATGPIKNEICAAAKGITFETSSENLAVGLVNDNAAFKGYSYLLIANGKGCMSTVLFGDFKKANSYIEETKRIFNNKFDLNLKEIKHMGGIGSFSAKNIFKKGKSLYVGEAAGLQDFLWGFGIKSAVTSGYLAARSIINGEDYEKSAERFFKGKLKASLVNRYLWERFGFSDYSFIVNRIHGAKDPLNFLNYFYNSNFIHKMLYPLAKGYMAKKYNNIRM
jgi:flavin-dependent dehydrogenase